LQEKNEPINRGEVIIMKIQTSRFGSLDVSDETLLVFPSGLVGFSDFRRFVVLDVAEDSDYQWFQSVEEPSFAFVIVDVHLLQSDFRIDAPDESLTELGIIQSDAILIMAVVTIPFDKPEHATANLRAPLVVNLRTRLGKQMILHESIPLRHPLLQAPAECKPDHEDVTEPAPIY
jgi:flagellar assembly factor FliW